MSFNFIRNARVFFTTSVDGQGNFTTTTADSITAANTREIQVLNGFTFSQATTTENVTISEAGTAPIRGQRQFNTALEPVDFSMSTYMRPADGGTNITAEESVLWNAMFSADAIGGSAPAWSEATTKATCTVANSNKNQLQAFALLVVLDKTVFIINNCAMDSATIDFAIDGLAMIQWAGKAATIVQVDSPVIVDGGTNTIAIPGYTDTAKTFKPKNTTAPFIANKLSALSIFEGISGSSTSYTIALTGGSLTISNNIGYLTPENLAIVNNPVTYFTGTRSITGSINAYLRTGSGLSGALLQTMLANSTTDVDPAYNITIAVGGTSGTHVDFKMPAVVLSIPAVNVEQVVSTTINFTAQGSASGAFDVGTDNELTVEYVTTNA